MLVTEPVIDPPGGLDPERHVFLEPGFHLEQPPDVIPPDNLFVDRRPGLHRGRQDPAAQRVDTAAGPAVTPGTRPSGVPSG